MFFCKKIKAKKKKKYFRLCTIYDVTMYKRLLLIIIYLYEIISVRWFLMEGNSMIVIKFWYIVRNTHNNVTVAVCFRKCFVPRDYQWSQQFRRRKQKRVVYCIFYCFGSVRKVYRRFFSSLPTFYFFFHSILSRSLQRIF